MTVLGLQDEFAQTIDPSGLNRFRTAAVCDVAARTGGGGNGS